MGNKGRCQQDIGFLKLFHIDIKEGEASYLGEIALLPFETRFERYIGIFIVRKDKEFVYLQT